MHSCTNSGTSSPNIDLALPLQINKRERETKLDHWNNSKCPLTYNFELSLSHFSAISFSLSLSISVALEYRRSDKCLTGRKCTLTGKDLTCSEWRMGKVTAVTCNNLEGLIMLPVPGKMMESGGKRSNGGSMCNIS